MPPSDLIRPERVSPLPWHDYRLLVESVIDYAIFMLDADGHIVSWNRGAEKIKGYTSDEVIGKHFSIFYSPQDIAQGKPQRELQIATEFGRVEDEGFRLRKDGSRFWASVVITALRNERGELRGFGKVTRDLTAKRAAESELRQSEQRFHHLIDAVTDYAIYMLDPEGRVSTWNSGAMRVKGYLPEEIIGRHFSAFYTPEDRENGRPARVLDVVRSEGRFEEEGVRVRKDGSHFWASVIITALREKDGTLLGFAKVTRDLTTRRRAEQTERELLREQTARAVAEQAELGLRLSEERYKALSRRLEIVLGGVADGITVQDRSGRVVLANGAAARVCGFDSVDALINTPPEEVTARFEILDENAQPFSIENFPGRRVLAGEPSASALMHVRERRTGREHWSLVQATAVLGADGRPELAINIWHDVSAERLQERQGKYLADATVALGGSLDKDEMLGTLSRLLVPGLADWCTIYLLEGDELRGVAAWHADPDKLAATLAYQRDYAPSRSIERGAWQVVRSGQSELHNELTDEMLARAARDSKHLELLRTAGMKAVLVVPIRARNRVLGALVLVTSESDRRFDSAQVELAEELGRRAGVAVENAQLFEAAQSAAKAAEEASRAKDEFLATVSHELRTPLSAILGWSKLLKDRVTDAAMTKPLEVIHRNAQAQVKIIDDILDVSRVITGKFKLEPRPADLVAITRDAIDVVRPSAAAKRIRIAFVPRSQFALLEADPERIQQAVWNLLSNAVKFTEPDGSIEVSVGQAESSYLLSVTDSGIGIDPRFLPFVFDRFKQADSSTTRRVSGLGLGLALVRHIIELHGGKVAAESAGLGTGAMFTITLPVRAVSAASEPPRCQPGAPAPEPGPALPDLRVLIVDDEPDARALIAEVLSGRGARVQTASSAQEGFDLLRDFRPDVVVSDIAMPGEDGFSFMRRVRALPEADGGLVPSIALTAFASEQDNVKTRESGYTTHLGKPVDPDALASTVAKLAPQTLEASH